MTSATEYKPIGIKGLPTKDSDKLLRRIATLVEMDARHIKLLAAGDKAGLLELAQEYRNLFALDTASRIEKEAEVL